MAPASTSSRCPRRAPPVCRIMDYGKWRYEQEQKAKQARLQSTITIKEIKFRPKIDPHDYATKKGPRRAVPAPPGQGEDHHHVPRPGALHPERGEAILLRSPRS